MAAVSISVTVTTTDPTVIIPEDAKIYNNHATAGGDDIYVSEGVEGPQLRFGPVGADWMLDDCEHLMTAGTKTVLIIAGLPMMPLYTRNCIPPPVKLSTACWH